jgi:hypothetical protein
MATIDFLPVCSNCHQVLWGETIGVEERDIVLDKYVNRSREVYPHRCPYCKELITSVAMPSTLPYYCEPLWPIKIKED